MDKEHIGSAERLWLAGEIHRLVAIAVGDRLESKWADNLIRNVYLWYWTADGMNEGEVQRDLFKTDTEYLRHTVAALKALEEGRKVTHEHAVPRKVLLDYVKAQTWNSPSDIKAFLDRFCFAVIIDKAVDGPELDRFRQSMPTPLSLTSDPMARYANITWREPRYPRQD